MEVITFHASPPSLPPPVLEDLDVYWNFMVEKVGPYCGKEVSRPEFDVWFYTTEAAYTVKVGKDVVRLMNEFCPQFVRYQEVATGFTNARHA